jgi:hypothetical protein
LIKIGIEAALVKNELAFIIVIVVL